MSATYEVVVLQTDRPEWRFALQEALEEEIRDIGIHQSVRVVLTESPGSSGDPRVGVYLGSAAAAADSNIGHRLEIGVAEGTVIIPVVETLSRFFDDTHPTLRFANGFEWNSPSSARKLARLLLEELGIEDRERRVFISHKREDGLGAAVQLHDRLSHAGFQPFIDRFDIRPGEGVQARIADSLEDYAFLLLLETPLANTSEWVFDEVDYALSHTMGVLILRWPGGVTPVPGSLGVPRLQITDAEIVDDGHGYDALSASALEKIVSAVEASHAQGLVRRRRMIVRSIEEAARVSGSTECLPLPKWRLRVEHPEFSTLVGMTPRLPTAVDLQSLDETRSAEASKVNALLVHAARSLSTERRKHLEWVVGDRDLELLPENAIGGWW